MILSPNEVRTAASVDRGSQTSLLNSRPQCTIESRRLGSAQFLTDSVSLRGGVKGERMTIHLSIKFLEVLKLPVKEHATRPLLMIFLGTVPHDYG